MQHGTEPQRSKMFNYDQRVYEGLFIGAPFDEELPAASPRPSPSCLTPALSKGEGGVKGQSGERERGAVVIDDEDVRMGEFHFTNRDFE